MIRALPALLGLGVLVACAGSEVGGERPTAPAPARAPVDAAPPSDSHRPAPAQGGEYFRVQDLIGRNIDALHASTCADAAGWELASGLMVDERALAVRRCQKFRGPHDVADGSAASSPSSSLTVISDGGRIVFVVATKEYARQEAGRVAETLLRDLTLAGCQQVYSDERNVGLSDCPGEASWAAVTRFPVPKSNPELHAVVLEMARDRAIAGGVARAYADLAARPAIE